MMTAAVHDLIARVAPGAEQRVRVELGGHGFTYSAAEGALRIRAEDAVAAAAAFHHYCTHHAGQRSTWQQLQLSFPDPLPEAPETSATTDFEHRYYLNFVTYGYSQAFWGWERWEQEIDWMALHSINRPLMTIGHEAILSETYRALGLGEDDALRWLGSAAHFPWMFMGGLNSWGGPVSTDYLATRLDLAHRVLDRMRSLGMRPILPGFGGQAPTQLATDDTTSIIWQGWHTPYIDPTSETYRRIAGEFYRIQAGHLGTDHLYAVDPFIESIPPREDEAWLTDAGAGIYRALATVDPEATWVLQAWPFHYHKSYWGGGRAEAFIREVPSRHILLLDLWAEFAPLWKANDAMFGRPWLWCAVHNYGGRFALFGDLRGTIEGLDVARTSPSKGQLRGLGLAMEAIENNEVFYEVLLDQVWGRTDLEEWLPRWALTRYGTDDPRAVDVWETLADTLYGRGRSRSTPSPIIARPKDAKAPFRTQRLAGEALDTSKPVPISANIDAENDQAVFDALPRLAAACATLLELPAGPRRDRDLLEILTHVVAQHARYSIRAMLRCFADDPATVAGPAADLYRHIEWLDRIAATDPEMMVGTWIDAARARATSPEEADRFEFDARSLVSVWGTQDSGLHDYSGRHWSGLLMDYYLPRWRIWAEWLAQGAGDVADLRPRIVAHEEAWRTDTTTYPTTPADTIETVARSVLDWLAAHESHPLPTNEGMNR